MKYQYLMRKMCEIAEDMHSYIYDDNLVVQNKVICYGKIYDSDSLDQIKIEKKEVLTDKGIEYIERRKGPDDLLTRDFRCSEVGAEVVNYAIISIKNKIYAFLKDNQDGDLQTLFLGCVLNLYYSSGLFDRCGILNLEEYEGLYVDDTTRNYAHAIEKLFYGRIHGTFLWLFDNNMFEEDVRENAKRKIKSYILEKKDEKLNEIVEMMLANFTLAKGFMKEYLRKRELFLRCYEEDYEQKFIDLQKICPEYQYGNLLTSIYAIRKYLLSENDNLDFINYAKCLDKEIYDLIFSFKKPSSWEIHSENGNIVQDHPECFSAFGLGLPWINSISKDESNEKFLSDLIEFRVTTEKMKKSLGVYYPCEIVDEESIARLLNLTVALKEAKDSELKAKEDKHMIIRQFSHTYMNMRATSLYNIAMELLKNPDKQYRNYGRKILYEYSVKQNLTKDVEMLKLRFEDNDEELYNLIKNSIVFDEDEGVHINHLVDEAIVRCMITLVHDASPDARKLREKLNDVDWISIRNSFENEILLSENCQIQKWFNLNMFTLNVQIAENWKSIVFERDSYAALLLTNILSEILTNIFRYADTDRDVDINFGRKNEGIYTISARNYKRSSNSYVSDSGYGLQAEANIFETLNKFSGSENSAICIQNDDDQFSVTFQISDKIFTREEKNHGV